MRKDQLWLQLLDEHLILIMLHKLHLLLVLLLWCQLSLVAFILLDKLSDCFGACQIDDIIFVTSFVTSNILIRCVSPVSINSEFVHDFWRIEKFNKVVCWRWTHSKTLLCYTERFQVILGLHFYHTLSLPIVEVTHNFSYFTSKWPLKDVFNFGPEQSLQMLNLNLC